MLECLGEIDWAHRSHAFGEASNVPTLLRAVAEGGTGADEAISELFNTVWHQGTVYDASSAAVPYLGELAAADSLNM
jgi:hypothetical protein